MPDVLPRSGGFSFGLRGFGERELEEDRATCAFRKEDWVLENEEECREKAVIQISMSHKEKWNNSMAISYSSGEQ